MHIDFLDWPQTYPNRARVFYKLEIILKCQTPDWKHLFKMVTADWSWCVVNVIHRIYRAQSNKAYWTLLFGLRCSITHSQSAVSRSCFALTFFSIAFKNFSLGQSRTLLNITQPRREWIFQPEGFYLNVHTVCLVRIRSYHQQLVSNSVHGAQAGSSSDDQKIPRLLRKPKSLSNPIDFLTPRSLSRYLNLTIATLQVVH
jgi:hypothetical protein